MIRTGAGIMSIFLVIVVTTGSCKKEETSAAKVKAPLRDYVITSRLDNKQAGTDSKATGVLKGTYSEKTKLFTYTITYETLIPTLIRIDKGAKGSAGTEVVAFAKNTSQTYTSPLTGDRKLTSLEERDLLKGLWYVSIASANFKPYEIRGIVTIKVK